MCLKKGVIVILLICFSFLKPSYGKDVVRLANGEWKPYLSKNMKHYGVASHIVTEAFASEGIDVEYVWYQNSWKRAYYDAKTGRVDGTLVWSRTSEREAEMYYSSAVITGKIDVFFHLKETPFQWNKIEDLKGMTLGGTLGYTYGEAFDNAEKQNFFHVTRVRDEALNFKILLKKRITAFICGVNVGKEILNKQFSSKERAQVTYHRKPIRVSTYHLLLTKAVPVNNERIKKFEKGLAKLKQNGTFDLYIAYSKLGRYSKDDVTKPDLKKVVAKPEPEPEPEKVIAESEQVVAAPEPRHDQVLKDELIKKHRKRMLLLEGSTGQEVEELQNALKSKGFYKGPIDSIFNSYVTQSVKQFQKSANISVDGIVGPSTRKHLGYSY